MIKFLQLLFEENNIGTLSFLVTLAGFYFAYYQWYRINRDRRRHIIKLISKQLECISPWVHSGKFGYGSELTEEQKFRNADPFTIIYNTGSSPLINATILEEISNVPEHIVGEINELYYDLKRIESIQNFRSLYTTSDINLSHKVSKKITSYTKENDMYSFKGLFDQLENQEILMVEILLKYGKEIHCQVIGNKDHGAWRHWEKVNDWIKKEKQLKNDYSSILISLIFSTLFVARIFKILNYLDKFNILCCYMLYVLIVSIMTVLLSYFNKSLIINNIKEYKCD